MKNLKYLTVLLCFIVFSGFSQDRPVYWIHGLNDSPDLWRIYGPYFQNERMLNSSTPNYVNNNGIGNAAHNLGNQIVANNKNFLIGHSLGGLAAREYERTRDLIARPNAILTVGTPHNGAFIANNVVNGTARTTINRAIADMTAGPFAQGKTIVSNMLSLFGINGIIAAYWANKRIDDVTRGFFARVEKEIAQFEGGGSIVDMQAGSAYLNRLNSEMRAVQVANIICEEGDRPGLRLANAAINPPENTPLHTYDDTNLMKAVDKLKGAYKAFRIFHDIQKFAQFWRYNHHNNLANQWQRGEGFMGNRFDAEYARLIGASRTERRTTTFWVQECQGGSSCMNFMDNIRPVDSECFRVINPNRCRWVQRAVTTTVTINEKSDGLVTDATQRMNGVPADRVYRARGVSHLEAGNHIEMTENYRRVFNRRDEFKIAPR